MLKIPAICIIILTLQIKTQRCEDSFNSVIAMLKLLETQEHLIKSIGSLLQSIDKKDRSTVKTYLAKLKKEHALSRSDPEHYLGNPINSYALIMRLYRDLHIVEEIIYKTRRSTIYKRNISLVYPSSNDVDGANLGLILLHVLYDLDIEQLADGVLRTRFSKNRQQFEEFVSPLTANDCFNLAKLYFIEEDRVPYITWLKQAYKRYKTDHELCSFTEAELLKEIAQNYGFMDDWNNTAYWIEKYLTVNKNDYDAKAVLENIKDNYDEEDEYIPKPRASLAQKFEIDVSSKLCHYERHMAGNVSLSCYYAHGPHRFLLLAPFRAEILHRGPDITMFYDVISDVEIEVLKAHVKPRLRRAEVLDHTNNKKDYLTWISHTAFVSYDFSTAVRVLRRIQQFTGLRWSQTTHDKMVIANYGLAGSFAPHCDFFDNRSFNNIERIATALLYLSNVEQGGATIFLHANLTVFPVKNAALFWYNLDAWGNPDIKTVHASCPVVRGSKWVANKWITVADQDLSRRCPMHPPVPENFKNACSKPTTK